MLHNLAVLSANSLLEYLQNQLSKPITIEDIVHPVTINEDGEEEYDSISQMPSQTSRISQVRVGIEGPCTKSLSMYFDRRESTKMRRKPWLVSSLLNCFCLQTNFILNHHLQLFRTACINYYTGLKTALLLCLI